ncbi:MAG: anaerobic ribonucleoside-triphosphate reductase activating protein [Oscillospiraceae bacterium]
MCKQGNYQNGQGIREAGAPVLLRLSGFVGDSIVDGPGLRCVVFGQGCPHNCPGCHNPATHPFTGGEMVSVSELFARIGRYPLCSGVTFSGGEPFAQPEAFAALARLLRKTGRYELAAYSGYTFEELLAGSTAQKDLLSLVDILIDGRFELPQKNLNLRFRGSANQRILHVPQSLARGAATWETAPRWVGGE